MVRVPWRARLRYWRRRAGVVFARASAPHGRRRRWVLVVGLLAIVLWQLSFTVAGAKVDTKYQNTAASGIHNDSNFVYFYWYAGLFPVVSTRAVGVCHNGFCPQAHESQAPADLTREAARDLIRTQPKTLQMDLGWTWFPGDRGKIWLYMFDAWLKDAPWRPSLFASSRLGFIVALCALFAAFWNVRRPWLGAALTLLVGSHPFQLYEVHRNDNVFGWTVTVATIVLALHVPLLTARRPTVRQAFVRALVTGALIGAIRLIRSEPAAIAVAPLLLYAGLTFARELAGRKLWLTRGALVATLLAAYVATNGAGVRYLSYKHEQARAYLARVGGHPFPGPVRMFHDFWHPVFIGLGDFDTKNGHRWEDTSALIYAAPILVARGIKVPTPFLAEEDVGQLEPGNYFDDAHVYKRIPYGMEEYADVVRDKVISEIREDPMWYAGILYHRVKRTLSETNPVRISMPFGWATIPQINGLWLLPAVLTFLFARARFFLRMALFTLPTSATAIAIYSGGGLEGHGIAHLVLTAELCAVAVVVGKLVWRRCRTLLRARVEVDSQPS